MSKVGNLRISVMVSLYDFRRSREYFEMVEALLHPGDRPLEFPLPSLRKQLILNFPSAVLPSTWTRGTSPEDTSVVTAEELERLRQWIRDSDVNLVPMGYSGAFNPFLTIDEARSEADWTYGNPWRSGLKDHFGLTGLPVLPRWSDPVRKELKKAFLAQSSLYGLGPVHPDHQGEVLLFDGPDGPRGIPYLRAESSGPGVLIHQIRGLGVSKALVHFEFDSATNSPSLRATISDFIDYVGREAWEITNALETEPGPGMDAGEIAPQVQTPSGVFNPDIRARLPVESRRSVSQDRTRTRLMAFTGTADTPAERKETGITQRTLLASMQGSASLVGDDFEVRFAEGRCTGFFRGQAAIHFEQWNNPLIRMGKRLICGELESAVSFESENSHGLRRTHSISLPSIRLAGRVSCDFAMIENCRHLIADIHIRYPWFSNSTNLDFVNPLSIRIRLPDPARGSGVRVRWRHIESSEEECLLPTGFSKPGPLRKLMSKAPAFLRNGESTESAATEVLMPGTSWIFDWALENGKRAGLSVRRMPGESPGPMTANCVESGSGLYLELKPEASFGPLDSDALRGLVHHFSLAIFPIFDFDGSFEVPPLELPSGKEVAPFYIVREA